MIEAVENHMPQVIIIDEIGTELEVLAARTIAEKGVQLSWNYTWKLFRKFN
jgi:stage III sporulation protein SpoIIIAA